MQTYGDYAPTGFDTKGLALPDQQDWLVVIGRNRDSDHLANSNFDTALTMLGDESDDVETHVFDHWACDWLEIIIVRPDSKAAEIAEQLHEQLSNYPALDESDWSEREYESYNEQWTNWGAAEFVRELVRRFSLSDRADDLLSEMDDGALQEWYESLNTSGDYYDSDASPNINRSVSKATRDDVAKMLRQARQK